MSYIKVLFSCVGEDWRQDLLIDDLAAIGFETFESMEDGFNAYIPSNRFHSEELENLTKLLSADFHVNYKIVEIAHQNWNAVWESNFEPIVLGNDCRVRASFHSYELGFTYNLVINPKMAFGTGHHQTTALMMKYVLEEEMAGKLILDMGCGTGILAILASMRGASQLIAIDNDPICYESVLENVGLNGVENLKAMCGSVESIPRSKVYDSILANINRNILLNQLSVYSEVLRDGGDLFLSGFYDGDDLVKLEEEARANGLTYISKKVEDGWAAVKFVKNL